ncbi:MAG TPA: hypothetical protein DD381_00540 [Lentisphaeria bacterium]|nr:MAG: hypothetical protein A2X47_05000 [Lentisphaerae bacterium GWF2_38_69]HBM14830.1 hypothetical protein [Lentisphaeria bacterium]
MAMPAENLFDSCQLICNSAALCPKSASFSSVFDQKGLPVCIWNNIKDLIVILDKEGKIITFNEHFEKISGYKIEEVKGKDWVDTFIPKEQQSYIKQVFDIAIKGQKTKGKNINPIIAKSGALVDIEWQDSILSNEAGETVALLAFGRDFSEHRRIEAELITAKEEAEKAYSAKSMFIAAISHEIRTPLTGIIGFAELLEDDSFGKLNVNQKMFVRKILDSSEYLLSLLNDALDISKFDAGKLVPDLKAFSLRDMLISKISFYRHRAEKYGIKISSYIPSDIKLIWADETMMKQVFHNLLSNALKFTPDNGKIHIRAKRVEDKYIITVSDTGVGIEKEDIPKIFEKFSQIKNEDFTPRTKGTGLGLVIVKKMVVLHNGSIIADSEGKNKGTSFKITIPIRSDYEKNSDY